MPERNRKDAARIVKPEIPEGTANGHDAQTVVSPTPQIPLPPAIMPGAWYTRHQVLFNLGIGKHTWERWVAAGMNVRQPCTKEQFVHSSEIDRMMMLPPDQFPPAYKSPYAEKNKSRKKPKE